VASARRLLSESQRGENPLSGWVPSVPKDGYDLAPGTIEYDRFERAGMALAGQVGYVVPAGGLGERLGFHGVKFSLPSEVSTGANVLAVCACAPRPEPTAVHHISATTAAASAAGRPVRARVLVGRCGLYAGGAGRC
jgi:hypothetical protein